VLCRKQLQLAGLLVSNNNVTQQLKTLIQKHCVAVQWEWGHHDVAVSTGLSHLGCAEDRPGEAMQLRNAHKRSKEVAQLKLKPYAEAASAQFRTAARVPPDPSEHALRNYPLWHYILSISILRIS
jgi:hypothetical protein